jgi:predicted nucleic acid-binding Zn ribbon protein
MRRKNNELTLKDAIEALMDHYHLGDRYHFEQVKQRWEEIVGKMIAQRTEKMFIKHKTLYLTVNSSVIAQELQMMKGLIVKRVNEEAGRELINNVLIS